MDYELDSKTVVDDIYGKRESSSDFDPIIKDCCHSLVIDLAISRVRFIRRQINKVSQLG